MTVSFDDKIESAREPEDSVKLADSDSNFVVQKMAEGEFEGQLNDKSVATLSHPASSGHPCHMRWYQPTRTPIPLRTSTNTRVHLSLHFQTVACPRRKIALKMVFECDRHPTVGD